MSDAWKEHIFKQKGLWEVYRLSRRVLPRSKSNKIIARTAAVVLVLTFGASIWLTPTYYGVSDASQFLRLAAEQSFVLSISILGFLIAGFSIFASVTKSELFITLAKIQYGETEINRLQFVFFNFLNVFTVYVALLALSLIIQFGVSEHSFFVTALKPYLVQYPRLAVGIAASLSFILWFWIVISVLRLKSFIWSLYQTVLVTIATNDEINATKAGDK